MIYEFCMVDWEIYDPYWFECDCSKEEFEAECRKAIDETVEARVKKFPVEACVNGLNIVKEVAEKLEKKFKRTKPKHRVTIGSSFPENIEPDENDWEKWPDVISEKSRKLIVESWPNFGEDNAE